MKKLSLVALALCASFPMLAQVPGEPGLTVTNSKGTSSLTIYGILDAGVAQVTHSANADGYFPVVINPLPATLPTQKVTSMYNGGISQTRWGLKGDTALGDGWKALFLLESAININSGDVSNGAVGLAQNKNSGGPNTNADTAVNGQLFARGAWFGVASDTYGMLTAGRHMSFALETIPGYDALMGAQLFTPIGFSGSYGGGGATDDSRLDNSLRYKAKFGDFNVAALHKFGGVAGSGAAQSGNEFQVGYEKGAFGVQAIYQGVNDASTVSNAAGLNTVKATWYNTQAWMFVARYKVGNLGLDAGYERESFANPSDPTNDLTITSLYGQSVSAVNPAPYTLAGGVVTQKVLKVYWLGARYDWTPKFNTAVSYYEVDQPDFSKGTGTAADMSGTAKYYSGLVDYTFTKAFDLYAGYMASSAAGANRVGYTYASNSCFGIGARYKF
jgi:predicted porin